jgi:hypothetical protein
MVNVWQTPQLEILVQLWDKGRNPVTLSHTRALREMMDVVRLIGLANLPRILYHYR